MRRVRSARTLKRQVEAFLVGLGSSDAEVAARLSREGVRGVPGDPDDCAVAVYLDAVLAADPQVRSVKVAGTAAAVYRHWRRRISVPLPEPTRVFIGGFDKGRFPGLVRASDVESAEGGSDGTYLPPSVHAPGGARGLSNSAVGDAPPLAPQAPGTPAPGAETMGPGPGRPLG